MILNETDLLKLINAEENEHLEFKGLLPDNKTIGEYAVALGNEGGGRLVFGISDRKPRKIVGIPKQSEADLQRMQRSVFDATGIRVQACPIKTASGCVLVIEIPSRPRGQVFHTKTGKFLMRSGEDLRGMTAAELATIWQEAPSTEGKPGLTQLALFETRRLRYEIEQTISFQTDWQRLNEVVIKLLPYGRDFDFDVKEEAIYAASLAADVARYEMPVETAGRICRVVSESLPITNLISRNRKRISEQDEQLLNSALEVVHSLAWDGCRYTRTRGVVEAASHLLTEVLRYAVLNEISATEKRATEIVNACIALCGRDDELVKILIFARDDALTYRGK